MESLEPVLGPAIVVALALLVVWLRGRDTRVTMPRTEPMPGREGEDAAVRELLGAGRKIDAIKRYRELHGVGLAEAKDAVEALQRGLPG